MHQTTSPLHGTSWSCSTPYPPFPALFLRSLLPCFTAALRCRFPNDVALVQRIVKYLAAQEGGGLRLSTGTLLTPRAFQMLGLAGLGSGGGFERLHYLLESFFDDEGEATPSFCRGFESW